MFQLATLLIAVIVGSCSLGNENREGNFAEYNFIVANDLGRNGYYEQRAIADQMGQYSEKMDIEFVAAVGDIHHFNGVASVSDPLWMTNFELIYSHPGLMIDWFSQLGNHEYRGNTRACIDYSAVSRRWIMPDRYYTRVVEVDDSTTLRLVFVDTTPIIEKYRKDSLDYPDAVKQNWIRQLQFVDSILREANETWTIVLGHHPVHAYTTKSEGERKDIRERLDPFLRRHKVDFYFSGHIHNFQHIQAAGSSVDYVVNSSASRSRPVEAIEGTVYCSDKAGFTVCSVSHTAFSINFVDSKGKVIYTYTKEK
ncbi:MAG: metallophosphoesterase [Paludibacter sp.]|jgi:hypothetical protein|nr:metallophosphoesterase [Paludibacter sp.]